MSCLPDIRDQGSKKYISVGFLWLCSWFTATTHMQGLDARLAPD